MSICKLKYITIAFFLIAGIHSATIKGFIYDQETKEPLIGASVFIEETSVGTASDVDGSYSISNIRSCSTCRYTLKATYIGYKTFSKSVSVLKIKSEDILVDIFLESETVNLDETTVTAERRKIKETDSPATIEIVSAGDIKREESTNLGSYLDGIKGVDFSSSGINNYSISVRGFNSSFTSRLLTLTDGRIANIPALRVINYSTVPQSSKDIENIEIVLGPSTALYGANAHSGVVNITSKSPADSEGFDISASGSIHDERDLYKLSTRWASKINKSLSMKVSASYLKGYDWEFISEQEYKLHTYPYTGFPARVNDRKDNNPWRVDTSPLTFQTTNDNRIVRIGDGEANDTGDPDQDGIMGEDWYNGYDDDGDGLIDEDYFFADGIDNDGDCPGDTNLDGCVCCGWNDYNRNGIWDANESNNGDDGVDENIDANEDTWFDGVDNDGNGVIDDNQEQFTGSSSFPNWSSNIENNLIIFEGRALEYIGSEVYADCGLDNLCPGDDNYVSPDQGQWNGEWDPGEFFIDLNGDGVWTQGVYNQWYLDTDILDNLDVRGSHYYDEDSIKIFFDVFTYDFGEDGIPGDSSWEDLFGNDQFDAWEGGNSLFGNPIPTESCFENPFTGNGQCGDNTDNFIPNLHDCGLDGLCPGDIGYPGVDLGEGNGVWDNFDWNSDNNYTDGDVWDSSIWIDNNTNGIPDENEVTWEDTFPYANGVYDPPTFDQNGNMLFEGEEIYDCGQDGLCPGDNGYIGPDFGEGNGAIFIDSNELDQIWDTGDNCFGCDAEPYIDINQNGHYDENEPYTDTNNDGLYTQADYKDNFQKVNDVNGDGLSDYPDFEVKNVKADVRIDYDPSKDFNFSFQSGYSWSKLNQVTGTGRYLADGYQYTYYQLSARYKHLYGTLYMNQGNSGNTRGYDLGNVINDRSKNLAFGLQHWFNLRNTKITYGIDYFKTIANSNGTVLNDGPNGYDNDGDSWFLSADDIDNDFDSNDFYDLNGNGEPDVGEPGVNADGYVYADGIDNDGDASDLDNDGYPYFHEIRFGSDPNDASSFPVDNDGQPMPAADWKWGVDEMIDEKFCTDPNNPEEYYGLVEQTNFSGLRDGKLWECSEGIDELDEFLDVESSEQGFYFQTQTTPKRNNKWEIISAIRIDKHDKLDEGANIAPKFGLTYKPSDIHEFTFSYGKAYNSPSAITLYTDLFITRIGPMLYYLRGNKDGTPYERVGDEFNISPPRIKIDNEYYYIGTGAFEGYWEGTDQHDPYVNRVQDAPYFLAFNSGFINVPDYIPLDTAIYTIYVPELNDTGRVYTALEALNVPDVEPIKTEKIQTLELAFKGFLSERLYASLNYYTSFYEDFFSAPTIVTPLIVNRKFDSAGNDITSAENISSGDIVGLLPINYNSANAPYGTQWDGIDNDNDWSSETRFPFFENNASNDTGCNVYDTCFQLDLNNPIFNIDSDGVGGNDAFDWSQGEGFDWAGSIGDPAQWGYVDYITCGGAWAGGTVDCNGHTNYTTGLNAEYGDTIGVTVYHPEDVATYTGGSLSFGNHSQQAQYWQAVGIDEYSVISRLSEAEMITSPIIGANGEPLQGPGTAFTPLHSILAPLNYGEVTMAGVDVGLTYFLRQYQLTFDTNFSFYKSTEYYNSLTKKNDPINAPKFKMNATIAWSSKFGDIAIKYKHVDQYVWKDGIWSGIIGPYDLYDILYNYDLTEHVNLNITIQNIFNKVHKEMVGGPALGRQMIVRLTTSI